MCRVLVATRQLANHIAGQAIKPMIQAAVQFLITWIKL